MKVSTVLLGLSAATAVSASNKVNNNDRTITITKSGWDPKATHKFGRFDHTTRVETTTVWTGQPTLEKRAVNGTGVNATGNATHNSTGNSSTTSHAAGVAAGVNAGVVGVVAAVGLLLI